MFTYTENQLEALRLLASPAHHIMLFGGSRSGKSFVLTAALAARALRSPGSRHAVIRRYCASARNSIGMDTLPKVLRTRFANRVGYRFNKAENLFKFSNGSEIWLIGLDDGERADKILGKEFSTIYFNECSELDYSSVQTALTRLAQNSPPLVNRAYYDCNPPAKNHWCYRVFVEKRDPVTLERFPDENDYRIMQMNPGGNRANLPDNYIENTLANLPERQRKRFLEGQWLDEAEGALWNFDMIDPLRTDKIPELERIVIGVDPAVTSGKDGDLTGIVAAGIDYCGNAYVLADRSLRAAPAHWVKEVVKLGHELNADLIVVEINNGGELISALFDREDDSVKLKTVRAFHDKYSRAEPVAAFYEKKLVRHAGNFSDLEAEMCSFTPGCRNSPDRMDALVWALSELYAVQGKSRFILA